MHVDAEPGDGGEGDAGPLLGAVRAAEPFSPTTKPKFRILEIKHNNVIIFLPLFQSINQSLCLNSNHMCLIKVEA